MMAISEHKKVEHGKGFVCEICAKSFSRKSVMICHVKDVHEQSGQYGCDFCEKKFLKKTAKEMHERKHTKPYFCADCGKAFDRQSSLNRHSETHGNQPYWCENCRESFTSYKARREGLKCDKCNVALSKVLPQITPTAKLQTFNSGDEGQNFIKQEDGSKDEIKSYEEEATSYSISNDEVKEDNLVHKIEEFNAETEMISCQICHKTFSSRSSLNRHRKLHDEHSKEEKFVENPSMQDLEPMYDNQVVDETYLEQTLGESEEEATENSLEGTLDESQEEGNENSLEGAGNRCKICLKSFTRGSSLTCHIKDVHEQSGNHACGFCDKRFYKESTKKVHERKHTGNKPFACEKCGKSFGRRASFDKHCKLDHKISHEEIGNDDYMGQDNPADQDKDNEMAEDGSLEQKMKLTNIEERKPGAEMSCKFCPKIFRHMSKKLEHERSHTGEKPFICDECGKSFPRKSTLAQHHFVHEKDNLICELCTKIFASKKGLAKHIKFVHEKRNIFCEKCSKPFSRKEHLTRHIESVHEQSEAKTHNCEQCDASYKDKNKLLEHVRFVHENEKNFCCEICTKRFARKADFTRHVADIHEQSGNFSCGFCERVFYKSHDKIVHERKHTNEKPFACSFCDKKFRRDLDKTAHERKHRGEKPHKCKKCGESFTSNEKKYQHMKTHEGLGQFPSAEQQQNVYNALYSTLAMMSNQAAPFSINQ